MQMSKGLTTLLVATLVIAGAALYLSGDDESAVGDAGELLYPTLTGSINDIELVSVQTAERTLTLVRGPEGWNLDEWGDYPAKVDAIRKTLVAMTQLRIDEPKTSRPDRYAALGVQDPSEPGAPSTRVRLRTPEGATLADLIVGNTRPGQSPGVYVRRFGEERSWLVKGDLGLPRQPAGWVDTELLRLNADRVVRVDVNHADGEWLGVVLGDDDEWKVEAMPEGSSLKYEGVARSLGGALSYLDLESVVASADVPVADDAWTATRFETREGLVVTVETATLDATTYARFAFGQVEPLPAAAVAEAAGASDEGAPGDAAEPDVDVAAEKAKLTARLTPWTFTLPKWKADALRKRMSDMLDLPEAPEPEIPFDVSSDEGVVVPVLPGIDAPVELPAEPPAEPAGDADDEP